MATKFEIKAVGSEVIVKCGLVTIVRIEARTAEAAQATVEHYRAHQIGRLTAGQIAKTVRRVQA